ncbi:MAG: 1-(5-phosphoribosyl)-5-[(5-phosphoribosylamino)methylideneamino] imidazole-4-carboxamide isomerase [Thermotoga sp. 50_1627]|uniref:HisA/HisF-related TIM barrel protein n=1 Tax=Pseudothermotoga sp. TaxID=2033661 RepID=UPI00076DD5D0|nr:MAG: 1-(5-phosphoribosyl)-5-[(5-phosphoribosylamino)methylideneamino] imidazole-4-carboxamide isomerase [Thermotoga sp. 50_64]KUK24153.1 MAG: 1-(5-phosphoribosyl)-5-[(5-phosphoribosylamino)methylideneamino] imidazole-4-carboxamide isomerase [Thermotoga sp. 50_1627]MBC7116194.1 tRNA-dihydrouridine synthase [Pseudothermotoga sp.]MDK2923921.1 phosphoribosylformimino-5-aminoimidazole carboxamide ribotide isomerase [Pseudothermotoga sp.]HBT38782.1 1-(5-phosphoribosyl)-5-((5-phosphoribosylamino)me
MRVIPAIDLYESHVVRFERGDKKRIHLYDLDPVELLELFVREGFELVHVVDLSCAIDGSTANESVLKKISLMHLAKFVQIGGGIRSAERAIWLRQMGFRRQILSSALIEDPTLICEILKQDIQVVFSLDTYGEQVRLKGWKETSDLNVLELLKNLKELGLKEVIHTDTEADGTLKGRRLDFTKRLAVQTGLTFIVAGGISNVEDLDNVRKLSLEVPNVSGVIVGRAFYEGKITLKEMKSYAR